MAIQGLGPYLFKFEDQTSTPPKNLQALIGRCISRKKKHGDFTGISMLVYWARHLPLIFCYFYPLQKLETQTSQPPESSGHNALQKMDIERGTFPAVEVQCAS